MAVMNIDLDDHNRAATNTTLKNDNAEDNNHDNDSNDVTIMIPPTNMFQARFCQSVTKCHTGPVGCHSFVAHTSRNK